MDEETHRRRLGPANTTQSKIERVFNERNTWSGSRGGSHAAEEIAVEKFECGEGVDKVNIRFAIKINKQQKADAVIFRNISLRPGENKGFEIELVEAARDQK